MFPSVESHRLRYNQMIFDQRAMTHKNLVKWYKLKRKDTEAQTGEASAADSAASIATISAIAHHAEAGGMDTVSSIRDTNVFHTHITHSAHQRAARGTDDTLRLCGGVLADSRAVQSTCEDRTRKARTQWRTRYLSDVSSWR